MQRPRPGTLVRGLSPLWWGDWITSEDSVRQEYGAYTRLSFMHGSLLPWYYGVHEVSARGKWSTLLTYSQFTIPDGRILYGILMEFVDAPTLDKLGAVALSDEEQIQFVRGLLYLHLSSFH